MHITALSLLWGVEGRGSGFGALTGLKLAVVSLVLRLKL